MSSTTELLKKTSRELTEEGRQLIIHPLTNTKKNRRKKHLMFVKFAIVVTYTLIGFMVYDLYNNEYKNVSGYVVVRNFLDVERLISDVEKSISNSLSLNSISERDIKSEEELINQIASKSIKLPDLNDITKNIPPINIASNPQSQTSSIITSRYDFFVRKAKEYEAVGNYKYAIFFYLRAFAERQSDYNAKYKVATLYHQIGQDELAIESAKESLNIKSDFLPAIEFLISIYNKTGKKPSDFVDILERSKTYYPNNREIKYTLAKLYRESGNLKAYEDIISSLKD